jgi:F420H(2)-dependent quinone reductase
VSSPRNWVDRTRFLWRIGNKLEAVQQRKLGTSVQSLLNPGQVLLLETVGRHTHRRRFTPVGYWQDLDGSFVVGGAAAGMTRTPDWVANLRAQRDVAVWVHRKRLPVAAHELEGEARQDAIDRAARIWPRFPRFEALSGRVVPFFRLEPGATGETHPT